MNRLSDRTASPVVDAAWSAFLIIGSAIGSLAFACATPFAAAAAIAVATLPPRLALMTAMGVWLGNQAVGFLLLAYPLTANSLMWGVALGGASLAATAAAIQVARYFDRNDVRRWLAVFAAALATEQAVIMVVSLLDGTLSLEIAAAVSGLNVVWFLGLAVIHRLLVGVAGRAEPAPATAR